MRTEEKTAQLLAQFEEHRDHMIKQYGLQGNGWWMDPWSVVNRYNGEILRGLSEERRLAMWEELYVRANTYKIARFNSLEAAMLWKLSFKRVA